MAEEIKEILEALKPHNDIKEYPLYLNRKQQDLLYDYITNLQQENKTKTHQIEVLEEIVNYERNIRNDKLQQENETLKAKLEIGKTCGFCPYYDYKSRCKRAMENIEESLDILKGDSDIPIATGNVRNRYLKPVLNILNGSDEK